MRKIRVLFLLVIVFQVFISCNQAPSVMPITTSSQKALQLYHQAEALSDNLKPQAAGEKYEQALELDPNFAMAHLKYAFSLANIGANDDFFEHLNAALDLSDQVSIAEKKYILSQKALVEGDRQTEVKLLDELLVQFPADKDVMISRALYDQLRQDWDSAEAGYQKIITLYPDYAPAYNALAYIQLFSGQYDKAEGSITKYTELIPDEPNPWDSFGEILLKQGKFEESIQAYEKVLELDPEFFSAYAGLGTNYMLLEEHDKALKIFETMHEKASLPEHKRNAKFHMARCCIDNGDMEKALTIIMERLQQSENDKDVLNMGNDHGMLARILTEKGDYEQASQHLQKSKDLLASYEMMSEEQKEIQGNDLLFTSAYLSLKQGDLQAAREKISLFGEKVKERGWAGQVLAEHQLLGMIALHEERWDDAITEFEQADPRNPRVMCGLARAFKSKGDKEKARVLWQKAANFNETSLNYSFVRKNAKAMLEKL